MKINSIKEANSILSAYVPQVASYTGDGMSLDRMWPLLATVGNPQNKLKAIHIAGTSGKTSTAYFIAAILQQSGMKTGLTVSPHVDSITERVQINGLPISDEQFCGYLGEFLDLTHDITPRPSYFELLIAFVFWVFMKESVDYAVVETGMGGLLDGTNVLQNEDKVCVITDIGFDHMHILGSTLPKIAAQKAGIIHKNNSVFMYKQSEEIMNQVKIRAKDKSAKLHSLLYLDLLKNNDDISKLPEFQKRNWLLAQNVCQAVAERDGLLLHKFNPESVIIPGRMDTVKLSDGTLLIMDGAHNQQKMETFVSSFIKKYPMQKAVVMLSLKQGKEYKAVIDALEPIIKEIILTTFNTAQDLPAKSQDTYVIAEYCHSKNISTLIIENNTQATAHLLAQDSGIKLITGSFYLLGQVRHLLHDKSVLV